MMDKSILTELIEGNPNSVLDTRLYNQYKDGLEREIESNAYVNVQRIADYLGMHRSVLYGHLKRQGALTFGLAMDVWNAMLIISTGRHSEQPILNKKQLRYVRSLRTRFGTAKIDQLCEKEGVCPLGRFERVCDDEWFVEFRRASDAQTYTQKEILGRCAAYTFDQEEWINFLKRVAWKVQPPRIDGRAGKERLRKMIREMGREWVAQILRIPIATLFSREYRRHVFDVLEFRKIEAVYKDPANQSKLKKDKPKEYVDRALVNEELLPFIEQRLTIDGKEKRAINHVRLARHAEMSYNQFRSKVYMGSKMSTEEYEKVFEVARMLYAEAEGCV
jgi:hypothetical protein